MVNRDTSQEKKAIGFGGLGVGFGVGFGGLGVGFGVGFGVGLGVARGVCGRHGGSAGGRMPRPCGSASASACLVGFGVTAGVGVGAGVDHAHDRADVRIGVAAGAAVGSAVGSGVEVVDDGRLGGRRHARLREHLALRLARHDVDREQDDRCEADECRSGVAPEPTSIGRLAGRSGVLRASDVVPATTSRVGRVTIAQVSAAGRRPRRSDARARTWSTKPTSVSIGKSPLRPVRRRTKAMRIEASRTFRRASIGGSVSASRTTTGGGGTAIDRPEPDARPAAPDGGRACESRRLMARASSSSTMLATSTIMATRT